MLVLVGYLNDLPVHRQSSVLMVRTWWRPDR